MYDDEKTMDDDEKTWMTTKRPCMTTGGVLGDNQENVGKMIDFKFQ